MPIFRNCLNILVLLLASGLVILSSCVSSTGGDDDEPEAEQPHNNPEAKTLTLIDSPLNGISYLCDGTEGVTEQGGKLYCEQAPVAFFLGDMPIGTLTALPEDLNVYLQDLVGVPREQYNSNNVVKLGRLLQSLDDDGVIAEAIDIPAGTAAKFIASDSLDDELDALAEIANVDLVTEPFAIAHLKRSYEGGEDATFYEITILVDDADAGTLLIPVPIELTFFGAEVLDDNGEAINSLVLADTIKVAKVFLRNPPQEGQVLNVQAKAEEYVDTGTSISISGINGEHTVDINMLKDQEGLVTGGVLVSKEDVSDKVEAGTVTQAISATSTEYFGLPTTSIEIPAGVNMTDADGNPVNGTELTLVTRNLRFDDARNALPELNNTVENLDDMVNAGLISDIENLDMRPLTFTTVTIADNEGTKVKQFSSDIEITMQLTIGTAGDDGNALVPGNKVAVFSYDEASGNVKYEKIGIVEDLDSSDNFYDVRVQTDHLTGWGAYILKGFENICYRPDTVIHFKDINTGVNVQMWHLTEIQGIEGGSNRYFIFWEDRLYSVIGEQTFINDDGSIAEHRKGEGYGFAHYWDLAPSSVTRESSLYIHNAWYAYTLSVKVYNHAGDLIGYQDIDDPCGGGTYDVLIDSDNFYGYQEARDTLDELSSASHSVKQEGVASHVGALQSVKTVSSSLTVIEDERGEELLDDSRDIVLEYAEAFFENNNDALADLAGSSINDLGCMSGVMEAYKEELNQNLSAYLAMGGENYSISELLEPLLEQVAEEYVDYEPLYVYTVDDSLEEYVACGFTIITDLESVGYAPVGRNLVAEIPTVFEPVILANVSAIRAIVDSELDGEGTDLGEGAALLVSAHTAAVFENILNVSESLANELMPLAYFSSAALSQIQSQQAYLDALKALGQIDLF